MPPELAEAIRNVLLSLDNVEYGAAGFQSVGVAAPALAELIRQAFAAGIIP
jgi:hypothetical protein